MAGAEPIRVLIATGTLVRAVAVYALTRTDDRVDVIGLDLDLSGPFTDDDLSLTCEGSRPPRIAARRLQCTSRARDTSRAPYLSPDREREQRSRPVAKPWRPNAVLLRSREQAPGSRDAYQRVFTGGSGRDASGLSPAFNDTPSGLSTRPSADRRPAIHTPQMAIGLAVSV